MLPKLGGFFNVPFVVQPGKQRLMAAQVREGSGRDMCGCAYGDESSFGEEEQIGCEMMAEDSRIRRSAQVL